MLPSFMHFISRASLARQHQHLDKQRLNLRQEPTPERGDAVVVRLGVGGDEAQRTES